jgi:hypothetical protein
MSADPAMVKSCKARELPDGLGSLLTKRLTELEDVRALLSLHVLRLMKHGRQAL